MNWKGFVRLIVKSIMYKQDDYLLNERNVLED